MKELICIVCPKGCHLRVDEENDYQVTGNSCKRGEAYGKKEVTAPTRTLTSVVRISGAQYPCCSVKTSRDIPRRLIPQAMSLLRDVILTAPAKIGDVAVTNICGTGADWIVTKNCPAWIKEERPAHEA